MTGILRIVMIAFDLLAIAFIFFAASAWRKRNRVNSVVGFLAAALFLSLGLLCGAITLGIHGYGMFTQEALAATIKTEPLGRPKSPSTRSIWRVATGSSDPSWTRSTARRRSSAQPHPAAAHTDSW